MEHISVILQRRQSWRPHAGHPGTMRQAGKQLYYSSGMAGSAEGEALTPILMRLYAAQSPRVCRRIRQQQSHSYRRTYCLAEAHLSPPFRKKKKKKKSLSISILASFLIFWQICCTLPFITNTALETTTHQSYYRKNNNPCWSVSSRILCKPRTGCPLQYPAANYWNENQVFLLND